MRRKAEGFIPVLIVCILIRPSTSSFKSIVSSLDSLEEIHDALQHAQNSLEDLTDLVFEVFTTEATTEAQTSVLTTLDTETSANVSLATMTPTSGETATPEPDTTSSETFSPSGPEATTTEEPMTTVRRTTSTEEQVTTESEIVTTEDPATPPETTDQQTEEPTDGSTDYVETTAGGVSIGDRLFGEKHSMFISSRKMTSLHFFREMFVKIIPYELRGPKEIDHYSGESGTTTAEPEASGSSTVENTLYTDEVTVSETGTSTQETTTELLTTTLGPWGDRVYFVLGEMKQVTSEISDGQADHEHAFRLEHLATSLDNLVIEGANDTSVLEGMSQEDLDYLNSVKNLTSYTEKDIKKQINKAKDDRQEMIVAITLLAILFVLVLVGLIVAMIRPWAGGFRLPGSKRKMRNTHDDSSYISNASFQDRSQQMRLNERRIDDEEVVV